MDAHSAISSQNQFRTQLAHVPSAPGEQHTVRTQRKYVTPSRGHLTSTTSPTVANYSHLRSGRQCNQRCSNAAAPERVGCREGRHVAAMSVHVNSQVNCTTQLAALVVAPAEQHARRGKRQ